MLPPVSGCPTATRPVVAREGLLLRVVMPGGRLTGESLARFAEGCAALGIPAIDLTNRGNIQVRGLSALQADAVADLAREAGLLPAENAGRRRALVASPLAGLDPQERRDPTPLVAALDAALLAHPATDALSPKCGFGVDGGGRVAVGRRSLDLVFTAEGDRWRLAAAGADLALTVADDEAAPALLVLVDLLVRTGAERAKALPHAALIAAFAGARPAGPPMPRPPTGPLVGPMALDGHTALGCIVPFGALPVAAAATLGTLADDIRLSSDRTIVLPRVADVATTRRALEAAGLSTDPASPYAILHACVGTDGCLRATTDVRAAARVIADALPRAPRGIRHIHVAGCARGCAHPRRADLLLLATGAGRYTLRRDADARAGDGIELAAGLSEGEVAAAVRRVVDGGGIGA